MKPYQRGVCLWVYAMSSLACAPTIEACRQHLSPLSRLACYDREAAWQPAVSSVTHPAPQLNSFALSHDADTITLSRQSQGATLQIRCQNRITHLTIHLATPWPVAQTAPTTLIDGKPQPVSWFLRQQLRLLEAGRGLTAIDHLKQWQDATLLQLADAEGIRYTIPLQGLANELRPLRQACHW